MKTSQFNRLLFWLTIIVVLFIGFLIMGSAKSYVVLGAVLFVLVLCLILFYKLDISVQEDKISFSFGIGLIKKNIPMEMIASVKAVKNSPLYGWGIRFNRDFTLYNVSGLEAIELTLKDQSRKIRIGTNIPHELVKYISKYIRS